MGGSSHCSMGKVLGAAFVALLVCSPPRPSCACSCVPNDTEVLELEILSVTRDGAPVTNLTPWSTWSFQVEASRGYVAVRINNNAPYVPSYSVRNYAPVR